MGDVSYRPLIEDMTWSYSRLKSFDTCPYQWFCHYISLEEEKPMFYASYGSFMHSLIEDYYSGRIAKENMPLAFLSGFSSLVQGERPSPSIVQKYIRAGKEYLENFREFPFQMIEVEKKLHFDIDGLNFLAFVDFIGERDGKLAIIDHKSRELKPRSNRKKPTQKDQELDEMLTQLYLYAHGVKQVYGEYPALLCFNCFRNGQFIEEPFDEAAYRRALEWAREKVEEICSEEEFRPYVDYFACKNLCGFHKECCYFQGR